MQGGFPKHGFPEEIHFPFPLHISIPLQNIPSSQLVPIGAKQFISDSMQ
jgi:hypothetical protein